MSGWTSTSKNKCSCFVARLAWFGCFVFYFFSCGGWDYKTHKISSGESADHPNGRGEKYCPGSARPFLPKPASRSLFSLFFLSFPDPSTLNLRGWENFWPPTSPNQQKNQNRGAFKLFFFKRTFRRDARPTSLRISAAFSPLFSPLQPRIFHPESKKDRVRAARAADRP